MLPSANCALAFPTSAALRYSLAASGRSSVTPLPRANASARWSKLATSSELGSGWLGDSGGRGAVGFAGDVGRGVVSDRGDGWFGVSALFVFRVRPADGSARG